MKPLLIALSLLLLTLTQPANAQQWNVKPAETTITVDGTHAGNGFTLIFKDYDIAVTLDPADPSGASIDVKLNAKTAKTGDLLYDRTLKEGEWLNTDAYPTIRFTSDRISKTDTGYVADGTITLKDKSLDHQLAFTLTPEGDGMRAKATSTLDRIALNVGVESDDDGTWVSRDLTLKIDLLAMPQ